MADVPITYSLHFVSEEDILMQTVT